MEIKTIEILQDWAERTGMDCGSWEINGKKESMRSAAFRISKKTDAISKEEQSLVDWIIDDWNDRYK